MWFYTLFQWFFDTFAEERFRKGSRSRPFSKHEKGRKGGRKGVPFWVTFWLHILKNALPPLIRSRVFLDFSVKKHRLSWGFSVKVQNRKNRKNGKIVKKMIFWKILLFLNPSQNFAWCRKVAKKRSKKGAQKWTQNGMRFLNIFVSGRCWEKGSFRINKKSTPKS